MMGTRYPSEEYEAYARTSIGASEIGTMKLEIKNAITRRLAGDNRDPAEKFGVTSTAIAETLADLIFAAAEDREHGIGLLRICLAIIEGRWQQLASGEAK